MTLEDLFVDPSGSSLALRHGAPRDVLPPDVGEAVVALLRKAGKAAALAASTGSPHERESARRTMRELHAKVRQLAGL